MPVLINSIQIAISTFKSKISISLLICIALGVAPFLPNSLWTDTGFHNRQRILEAMCLTSLLYYFLRHIFLHERPRIRIDAKVIGCLSCFFLIGSLSCLGAFSVRYALYEWSSFVLLILLAWVIASEVTQGQTHFIDLVLSISGVGCAYYLLQVVLIYVSVLMVGGQPKPDDFIFGFDNYRFFNHTQTISLSILTLLALRNERHGKNYWFWLVVASLWWTMLFVTAGRGTFVGLMAGVAAAWLFRRRLAGEWCRVMVYTCFAGAAIYLLFFTFVPLSLGVKSFGFSSEVVQRTMINPSSNREPLWQLAWQMIAEHPWLGAGPLQFAHYGPSVDIAAHPHNLVLQIASEWGIPALIFLSVAIGLAFRALLRIGRDIQSDDAVNQATLCAWLTIGAAILVDGMVSGLIVMPTSQLWIALYIGCAWGWVSYIVPASSSPMGKSQLKKLMPTALIIALVLFWNGLFPEIADLTAHQVNALKSSLYSQKELRPRIWAAGYF